MVNPMSYISCGGQFLILLELRVVCNFSVETIFFVKVGHGFLLERFRVLPFVVSFSQVSTLIHFTFKLVLHVATALLVV